MDEGYLYILILEVKIKVNRLLKNGNFWFKRSKNNLKFKLYEDRMKCFNDINLVVIWFIRFNN